MVADVSDGDADVADGETDVVLVGPGNADDVDNGLVSGLGLGLGLGFGFGLTPDELDEDPDVEVSTPEVHKGRPIFLIVGHSCEITQPNISPSV